MTEAVIVAAGRSPIGRAMRGSLIDMRMDDLGAVVVGEVLKQIPQLPRDQIQDLLCGCGMPGGEQGHNIARIISLLAGLDVPGTTVNRYCSSSLQTTRMAFHAIKAGEGDVFLSVGVDSASRTQFGVHEDQLETRNPRFQPGNPEGFQDVFMNMGETAEQVADEYGITREDMDRFALHSQQRASGAQTSGFFAREIVPVKLANGDMLTTDDSPRADTTLESLGSLKPAFRKDGRVTAGNACPLNDGAAALVIMSDTRARELGIKPLARIVATGVSSLNPEFMGMGPVGACRQAMQRVGMTIDDVDVLEINEAFAAQVIPSAREIGVDPFSDKLNPHGGAIALGHPYGMTGARILCTLMNDLRTQNKTIGMESMCVAGGQGMAIIVERLN
jgi:acetyl-CoA C-acetyltransferase